MDDLQSSAAGIKFGRGGGGGNFSAFCLDAISSLVQPIQSQLKYSSQSESCVIIPRRKVTSR